MTNGFIDFIPLFGLQEISVRGGVAKNIDLLYLSFGKRFFSSEGSDFFTSSIDFILINEMSSLGKLKNI